MPKYITRQRRLITEYLSRHADELISAQSVADALKDESVSQSSVYRNLSELEEEGKLRRGSKGGAREVYYQYTAAESCRGCVHLSCTSCGRTFHMEADGAEKLASYLMDTQGFRVDRAETVLYGVCRECRK